MFESIINKRNAERIIFIVIILCLVLWKFSEVQKATEASNFITPTSTIEEKSTRSQSTSSACPPCNQKSNNNEGNLNQQQCPNNKNDENDFPHQKNSLQDSLAFRHKDLPQRKYLHAGSPVGRAKFIHPSFQDFKFSQLLSSIDVGGRPVRQVQQSPRLWNALGLFNSKIGEPDEPYSDCQPTKETAFEDVFGVVSSDSERLIRSRLKSNPIPSETCMSQIEPLNPKIPLQKVASGKHGQFPLKSEKEKCALNKRRFRNSEFRLHQSAIDDKETERRKASDTKFLASVCPDYVEKAPRKVFIDLGARHYLSSAQWFRSNYPKGKDFIIHGFDVASKWAYSFQFDKKANFYTSAIWNDTGYVSFVLSQDTFGGFFHKNFFDAPLDLGRLLTVPAVALSDVLRFLVTKDDFVVVKMDVEGTEWTLMKHLASTGSFDFIDEMFIECHHAEYVPKWPTDHSLADCHRMFNSLRKIGVYAHEWY